MFVVNFVCLVGGEYSFDQNYSGKLGDILCCSTRASAFLLPVISHYERVQLHQSI